MLTKQEIKKRHFEKVYEEALLIECACGCGTIIKNKDHYGRNKQYISGHNRRKYKDSSQYKREWNHRNRLQRFQYKKKFIRDRKILLIKLSNEKCSRCGYSFDGVNDCIFDFHHLDSSKKLFSLNKATLNKKSWSSVLEEYKKCVMVCANCHRLIHNNYN